MRKHFLEFQSYSSTNILLWSWVTFLLYWAWGVEGVTGKLLYRPAWQLGQSILGQSDSRRAIPAGTDGQSSESTLPRIAGRLLSMYELTFFLPAFLSGKQLFFFLRFVLFCFLTRILEKDWNIFTLWFTPWMAETTRIEPEQSQELRAPTWEQGIQTLDHLPLLSQVD